MGSTNCMRVIATTRLSQCAAALCLLLAAPAWAGFDEDVAAFKRGDYVMALRPLAERGDAKAQTILGRLYDGGEGVPKDYAEAAKWFKRAAQQGHGHAQYSIGIMYYDGSGVPKDYEQAATWYKRAAKQGNIYAQCSLGDMFYIGQGVPQDYTEAVKWYRRAAEQGIAYAQDRLGFMYSSVRGAPQNYVQAHLWFNLAAARGLASLGAHQSRDVVAQRMTPAQIAEAQKLAREWSAKFKVREKK